jgi:hypothetical protein
LTRTASSITAVISICTKLPPKQVRGPAPKGMNSVRGILAAFVRRKPAGFTHSLCTYAKGLVVTARR